MLRCIGVVRLSVLSLPQLHSAKNIENERKGCSDVELCASPVTAFSVIL